MGDDGQQFAQVQDGHTGGPAGRGGVELEVGREEPVGSGRTGAAPQHGQVDLGPHAGDSRADDRDPAAGLGEEVAGPQVAVGQDGRHDGDDLGKPGAQPLDGAVVDGGERLRGGRLA